MLPDCAPPWPVAQTRPVAVSTAMAVAVALPGTSDTLWVAPFSAKIPLVLPPDALK